MKTPRQSLQKDYIVDLDQENCPLVLPSKRVYLLENIKLRWRSLDKFIIFFVFIFTIVQMENLTQKIILLQKEFDKKVIERLFWYKNQFLIKNRLF